MNASSPVTVRDLVDPKLMASVEDLEMIARWVVEGFLHGLHRSPYVGFSVDFASHRQYMPGDDLRHLNWKIFGRHDRLYIKQYDAETNVDLHLVLDVSGSMTIGDGELSKLRYGVLLCASLAYLASRQRDAVGLTLFSDRVVQHYEARGNTDHILSLLSILAQKRAHAAAKSCRALHEAAEMMQRRGLVVVISDFFFEPQELMSSLDHFRHFGHDVLTFQLLAPLERRLPVDGPVKLVDVESGESLETVAHEIRASFEAAAGRWIDELHRACQARDIEHVPLVTDETLEGALTGYLLKRTELF